MNYFPYLPKNSSDISLGTKADLAYKLFIEKKTLISNLQFECDLLIDKYHAEMSYANTPSEFSEPFLLALFNSSTNEKPNKDISLSFRKSFLQKGFSKAFLDSHSIDFVSYYSIGYTRTFIGIKLLINDFIYSIEFPQPKNIFKEEDKKHLLGQVMFRVDRIHKSKDKPENLVKSFESVQPPTYDWKKCFDAIELFVSKDTNPKTL